MAKDYGEMEREFIAGLKEDTGRDLAEWMAAIGAEGFTNKNAAIDWLRGHGFVFNWASWLERIHANGGRPLYGDKPAAVPPKRPAASAPAAGPKVAAARVAAPTQPAALVAEAAPQAPDARLEELIAAAKGYQPLYRLLAGEMTRVLPGVQLTAAPPFISVSRPAEFAVIETSARGLRLALDLGDRPFAPPLVPVKLAGTPKRLSHMIVLDDARSIDVRLMELIKAADARVNA